MAVVSLPIKSSCQPATCVAFGAKDIADRIAKKIPIYGITEPLTREIIEAAEKSNSHLRLETKGVYLSGRVEIISGNSFSFRTATGIESFEFDSAPTLIHAESSVDFDKRLVRLRSELPKDKMMVFDAAMGAKLNGQRVRIELQTPTEEGGLFITEIFGSVTAIEDHFVRRENETTARETLRFYVRADQSRDWVRKPNVGNAIQLGSLRDELMAKTVINHSQPLGFDIAEPYLKKLEVLTTAADISPAHLIGPLGWFYLKLGGPRDVHH